MSGHEETADIVVVGGGAGGVAAALAALRLGRTVILTEETDWLGGQLTSQGVPPDEHPWIESTGATASYRAFRTAVRDHYRRRHPLTAVAHDDALLNPGGGYVSPLCHEPRVGAAVLDDMVAPWLTAGRLVIRRCCRPVAASTDGDMVTSVTVRSTISGDDLVLTGRFIVDATELGDVLELAAAEHGIGAETAADTGELHAIDGPADPLDQQAVSWCFALDHRPGEDHTIDRPAGYQAWHEYRPDFWPGPLFAWEDVSPVTLQARQWPLFADHRWDLWRFRRIVDASLYAADAGVGDVTLVNWPQIDYWLGPLVGVPADLRAAHTAAAHDLSLSFVYWMQTDAPRPDGGVGWPGLRLRGDALGTPDGLAKAVYVRESRRIQAELTVTEAHVGVEQRAGLAPGAEVFADSVGTGCYRIDLHPSTALRTYVDISCYPFQIPLRSLIPVRIDNLLPGAKNLGVTHITNGCYRVHPVEWNVGEAAGALAAHCVEHGLRPRQVAASETLTRDFQRRLRHQLGFVLWWPEHARTIAV